MRAQFHLNGSLDVVVEGGATNPGVSVTAYEGTCYEHHLGDEACKERKASMLLLNKHQARAIASAIMGCAAEA